MAYMFQDPNGDRRGQVRSMIEEINEAIIELVPATEKARVEAVTARAELVGTKCDPEGDKWSNDANEKFIPLVCSFGAHLLRLGKCHKATETLQTYLDCNLVHDPQDQAVLLSFLAHCALVTRHETSVWRENNHNYVAKLTWALLKLDQPIVLAAGCPVTEGFPESASDGDDDGDPVVAASKAENDESSVKPKVYGAGDDAESEHAMQMGQYGAVSKNSDHETRHVDG